MSAGTGMRRWARRFGLLMMVVLALSFALSFASGAAPPVETLFADWRVFETPHS